jgi:hypothetical protein
LRVDSTGTKNCILNSGAKTGCAVVTENLGSIDLQTVSMTVHDLTAYPDTPHQSITLHMSCITAYLPKHP